MFNAVSLCNDLVYMSDMMMLHTKQEMQASPAALADIRCVVQTSQRQIMLQEAAKAVKPVLNIDITVLRHSNVPTLRLQVHPNIWLCSTKLVACACLLISTDVMVC